MYPNYARLDTFHSGLLKRSESIASLHASRGAHSRGGFAKIIVMPLPVSLSSYVTLSSSQGILPPHQMSRVPPLGDQLLIFILFLYK